jgi:hypothetical protein
MFIYGLQHVMSMYAGVVAVPLIVGGAMGLEFTELAYLLTAALLISGLATLLQTLGCGGLAPGIRSFKARPSPLWHRCSQSVKTPAAVRRDYAGSSAPCLSRE